MVVREHEHVLIPVAVGAFEWASDVSVDESARVRWFVERARVFDALGVGFGEKARRVRGAFGH